MKHSKKSESHEAKNAPIKFGWSVGQSVWVGLGVFFIPQFILGFVLIGYARFSGKETISEVLDSGSEVLINFSLALFVSLVGSGLLYLFVRKRGGLNALGFKRTSIDDLITTLPVFFGYLFSAMIVFGLVASFLPEVNLDQQQDVGFDSASGIGLILAFITLVILAPIYEEALFRGFAFQGVAAKYGFWPSAILTSGLFAVAHGQLNVGIDTFILGMFSCWLIWHTNSLWPSILLHMLKNLLAYTFLFIVELPT
jgi:membrane protease YdiL (CAAX protease family)